MTKKKEINIFWFRRDLRLDDNIGLYFSLKQDLPVLPIFIFDNNIISKIKDPLDKRVHFIHTTLLELKQQLNEIDSDLRVYHGDVLDIWETITSKYNVKEVYSNEDYEPYARKRDSKVKSLLNKNDIKFHQFKDQCIFAKDDILKKDNTPYIVYTAYKNKWLSQVMPEMIASYHCKKMYNSFIKVKPESMLSLKALGFSDQNKIQAPKVLKKSIIQDYDKYRDIPSLDATTRIGVHLRFGTISVRKCVQIAHQLNKTWLEELMWREFFMQILYHFPHVTKGAFKEKYNGIKWINNRSEFKRWCEGRTGFALVDAGIRELNETGHMHNRVRMVVASFLVKDLLIDWKWGEKYFASKLLDFELSSNNGNWQWVAGTGCDSAPYFRIFNPDTQIKRFDPDYEYIKKWIPEFGTSDYPEKMIDHNTAYHRALRVIKSGISS